MTLQVVDTHPLIGMLEGNPPLGAVAHAVLDDPQPKLVLPVTAFRWGVLDCEQRSDGPG